jgi:MFS transporter, DHA1 family, tetracycline resistance protein
MHHDVTIIYCKVYSTVCTVIYSNLVFEMVNSETIGDDASATSDEVVEETTEKKADDLVSKSALIALAIAYLSVFIDILGVSIILPIIPFLALEFNASPQQIGFIYAGYAGAQMISVPVSGRLSDKLGRRPLMLISLFGSFAGFMFQGLAWNISSFIMARVVAGAFGGSIPICQSYIADVIPVQQRGRYFAMLGSVIITAFLFGPGIGAGLAQFTLQTPMFVAASVAFFGLILAYFFFQEPTKQTDHATNASAQNTPGVVTSDESDEEKQCEPLQDSTNVETQNAVTIFQQTEAEAGGVSYDKYSQYTWLVRILWMASFFQMLAFSSIIYFFGLFVFDQFGWESLEVGFATMLMGVFQVIVQIILFPKVQLRIGKHGCGMLGCAMGCVGLLLVGFVVGKPKEFLGIPLLVFGLAFVAFGNAIVVPSLSSILSRYTSQAKQGANLGVAQSAEAFARTVGPLVWGAVYTKSRHLPFQISTAFYVIAGVLFYIVLFQNYQLPEHRQHDEGEDGACLTSQQSSSALDYSIPLSDLAADEQVVRLLEENRQLKEKLRLYEEMFDIVTGDGSTTDIMDIQTFHK